MMLGIVGGTNGAAAPSDTPFISSTTPGTLRNDFTGCLGGYITVGGLPITLTSLGRWVAASGTQGNHLISLVDGADFSTVLASVTVNTSGAPTGAYKYGSVTPVVLSALGVYLIFSQETDMGDSWYSADSTLSTTAAAVLTGSAYQSGSNCTTYSFGGIQQTPGTNTSYVPVNFLYQ